MTGVCRPLLVLVVAFLVPPTAAVAAPGKPGVAALQVALKREQLYSGPIDGLAGAGTKASVEAFQRRAGLGVDGVPGKQTRAALGPFASHGLGSRLMSVGMSGWDVAALQFTLAWHGFPSATITGNYNTHVAAAVLRFQHWAGLPETAIAGPRTLAALSAPLPQPPLRLNWPLRFPIADGFGPRHDRFHTGIDIPAATGTPVAAAGSGLVTSAGWSAGGWGYIVAIDHGHGLNSIAAHLSRVDVRAGQRVLAGMRVGAVGSSGDAKGPHLHFEVRLRDAALDPLEAFGP
jgi:murein DD-endopeptidase MepM/ murein hydrolase activator NlpD